jgi:GntR family transcriptional regulator
MNNLDTISLPKYYQISQKIIADIQNGILKPGMQIPSENEIIRTYSVSNTTARKVLNEIQSLGWAVKVKGKGTYVQRNRIERSATRILGFNRNMIEAGFVPSTKVLETRVVRDGYSAEVGGRQYNMQGPVFKIHRLRYANDIPMLLEIRYISMQFCPGIEEKNFDGSLYDIYEKEYTIRMREIIQDLSSVMMDKTTLSFFDLRESTPAIQIDGVTFCGKEMILEMEKSVYRGDKYRFTVRAE